MRGTANSNRNITLSKPGKPGFCFDLFNMPPVIPLKYEDGRGADNTPADTFLPTSGAGKGRH